MTHSTVCKLFYNTYLNKKIEFVWKYSHSNKKLSFTYLYENIEASLDLNLC